MRLPPAVGRGKCVVVMHRREMLSFLGAAATSAAVAGCKRRAGCARCGMALDAGSRWYVEIDAGGVVTGYDTPKCALSLWLKGGSKGVVFARGYYRQQRLAGAELVFVEGSDVLGPMGQDLVPVEPDLVTKFMGDHKGSRAARLDELRGPDVDEI